MRALSAETGLLPEEGFELLPPSISCVAQGIRTEGADDGTHYHPPNVSSENESGHIQKAEMSYVHLNEIPDTEESDENGYPSTSPRSTTRFESMADSPLHSYGSSALRELLELQRQKSTILKKLNLLHENLVVPSQQFWSVAAEVCDDVATVQAALKPTIDMHVVGDDVGEENPDLDLRGVFKDIENMIGLGDQSNLRFASHWSDAQSLRVKMVNCDNFLSQSRQTAMTALRLLDRTFVLRQRLACHDAVLTLHRNMWLVRDEQWEGYAGETEAYYIHRAKIREKELVQELAQQEEELQEVQEALRIVLRAHLPPASSRVLPPTEAGHPTVLPGNLDSVRDLKARIDAAQSSPPVTSRGPSSVPTWGAMSDENKQTTLTRSMILMSKQVQALQCLAHIFDKHETSKQSVRRAFVRFRRLIKGGQTTTRKARIHTPSPQAIASVVLLSIVVRQIERRILTDTFRTLYSRDAIESSSRNCSAVSLVMMPTKKQAAPKDPPPPIQRSFHLSLTSKSPTASPMPVQPMGRQMVSNETAYTDRVLRRPQTARSLSPPQFHSREVMPFTRGSSGDLIQTNSETKLVLTPGRSTNVFTLTDVRQRQVDSIRALPNMLGTEAETRARQPPYRRQANFVTTSQYSPGRVSPTHTFMPAPMSAMPWNETVYRPALQTQRLFLTGQPTEVQKPRALPPMRLPMYDWQHTPSIRNHLVQTWR
eukprot:Blabericola_migrator_1__7192@NODE_364_length_9401_cov_129_421898_g291_i0_p1_GENE_NODE_364_length_9401_cov_129_421898_g291_i0NODE_364_length_9401_cov_129_421898_g291_i0_p1_ORF_typecomplete_len710_score81_40_NODE_364_length_9401_cov_129_421898_g291_i0572186